MRHFGYLNEQETDRIFAVPPQNVTSHSAASIIALSLGATLYSPGTRPTLDRDAERVAAIGTTSMVWCLEDAIPHAEVTFAERNITETLHRIYNDTTGLQERLPLIFVRVRNAQQIKRLADAAGPSLNVLTGFSLPKITETTATEMLTAVKDASVGLNHALYGMPILETPELAYIETRRESLLQLAAVFDKFPEQVLCIRVGGTDLSGIFGLRRDRDVTIWDVSVVRECLSDIINVFGRHGKHVVTGAVWEHIAGSRLFKPTVRETPFHRQHEDSLRAVMVENDVDVLLREITLDKANGILGKTVIHPSHVTVVNSLLTVSREEYDDALAILTARNEGGVLASDHGRMNEIGPHALWAELIYRRAVVYGVVSTRDAHIELLSAGKNAVETVYSKTEATSA